MKTRLTALVTVMVLAAAPAFGQGPGAGHTDHGGPAAEGADQAQSADPARGPQGPMMQGGMMPPTQMPMQMPMDQMDQRRGAIDDTRDMSASSIAFRAVNEAMHHQMNIELTGDADVDFVRGMIAHHQGAIDMAKIIQVFGSDSEIAALAEEVVNDQEAEIAMMRDWLSRNAPDQQD
ncbi:DUF305 domain-containing protein [Fodinicurvata sp. EGI_FJ10296]|uniref:CopM family metallochaperone n=1 Tax=Fodinicurvata sp. EGI_FJ10296 TaxID=3231908 RepID=UPI003453158D